MVSVLWLAIGLIAGAFLGILVVEATGRGRQKPSTLPSYKLVSGWSLREFEPATLVARHVEDLHVPSSTTVLCSGRVDPDVVNQAAVQQVTDVGMEYILDETRGRVLLLLGGARPGTLGLLLTDEGLLDRLKAETRAMQGHASDYVERLKIREISGRTGVTVETRGMVQDVVPYKDSYLLRLEDEGQILGVLVSKDPSSLLEQRIQVSGPLERNESGYIVLKAKSVRRIR